MCFILRLRTLIVRKISADYTDSSQKRKNEEQDQRKIYCIEYGPSVVKYIEDLRETDADYVNEITFGEDFTLTYNDNGKIYNGTYKYVWGKGVISLDSLDDVNIYYERGVLTVESSGGVWLIFHYKRAK